MLMFTVIGVLWMSGVIFIFGVMKIHKAVKSYLINRRGMDKWDADGPAILLTIFIAGFIFTIFGWVFR